VRVVRVAAQLVVVVLVAFLALWLWSNVRTNAEELGIPLGFGYLDQPAGFSIPGSDFNPNDSVGDALRVGLANTLRIALAGIVLSTVLGVLIGIARLSTNWLVRTAAKAYVEIIRNIPLLVIVVFSYLALFLRLPRIEDAVELPGWLVVSVRGVVVPWFDTDSSWIAFIAVMIVGVAVAWAVARWRRRVAERTGRPSWPALWAVAAFAVVAIAGYLAFGAPIEVTGPDLQERQVIGGITMAPEYAALLFALVIYTASHIAEIVRGSIQAVPKGQHEAATALALGPAQRMRFVILPQALRIGVPAIGNQYLNLTKNSSLAVAISYFELTKVTEVSVANRAPAVPSFALLLVLYLILSLLLSAGINLVNRRLALVER
jgi:general L-amino acid transport system permease protein